jgi:hypothetical protein
MALADAIKALNADGYDTHERGAGAVYITGFEIDSDDEWEAQRQEVLAIVAPHGCSAEWVDDDLVISAS